MTERQKHQLKKGTKLDDAALSVIALCFCQSIPVDHCAARVGVSRKRVRDIYLDLRDRLSDARFARWHGANVILPRILDGEALVLIKSTFFDVLEDCHGNAGCYKNFKAGNRRGRICSVCTIPDKMTSRDGALDTVAAIDVVRTLYQSMKLHGERRKDGDRLFRRRFIHMAVMATAVQNTQLLENGLPDWKDTSELSLKSLLHTLLVELIEKPM